MKKNIAGRFVLLVVLLMGGCAYLGAHGPSIHLYPDVHAGITEDGECLGCHHPDAPQGTPTPHPNLKGCLKCHQDDVEQEE